MSKKTRKKSSKPSSGRAATSPSKASAKKPAAKTAKTGATKSGKPAGKTTRAKTGKPSAKASHKAASKTLKSAVPRQSAPRESVAATSAAHTSPPPKATAAKAKASSSATKSVLAEGAMAPGFRLPRDGGDTVSLADYAGRKLVLFFYPRADTPGCTREAIDFTRLASAFDEAGTALVGVSADPVKAQEAFRDKHALSVPLISDETHEMLEAYGVWGEKSMYGKTFLGIVRSTVLIGGDGRVIRIWRNVKVDGHADEVLSAARTG